MTGGLNINILEGIQRVLKKRKVGRRVIGCFYKVLRSLSIVKAEENHVKRAHEKRSEGSIF